MERVQIGDFAVLPVTKQIQTPYVHSKPKVEDTKGGTIAPPCAGILSPGSLAFGVPPICQDVGFGIARIDWAVGQGRTGEEGWHHEEGKEYYDGRDDDQHWNLPPFLAFLDHSVRFS